MQNEEQLTCKIEDLANCCGGVDDDIMQKQSSIPLLGDKAISLLFEII
jgi:ubiquitin thioesterase protein OTUB1